MKWLLLLIISFPAMAQTLSEKLEAKKYYYSALNEYFLETYSKEITQVHVERLEKLLFFTGIELLEDYDHTLLEKYPTSSTRFILARRHFHKKDFKKALEYFGKVHKDHRYYPEALLLTAQVYGTKNDFKQEEQSYSACQQAAEKEEGKVEGEKIKRYYRMIYEICLTNKARRLYKEGKFKESLAAYGQIPKQSYKWPYIILEQAWAHYQLGDFNRALGLLVTYKSPLLDTYFFPEAEYLTALAYFRLCLYEDSLIVINQYYQAYRPRFTQLENVLRKNRNSQNYFYDLMFKPGDGLAKEQEFVRHIITRLKKQTRFSLDYNSIHKINQEMKRVQKNEKKDFKNELLDHLASVKENMINKINYNAKTDIFNFLETVPFFSSELFKVNLEVLSKQKDLVYSNRKLAQDRARGDYSNVKRSRFEQFWKFEGEFWGDELGDYSLGLKSSCQTERIESAGE
ncbi:MAG: hypothetical protein H0V66_13680 [Bdellovibrionales bacterium]|nr:hypothetical protein [Bdellovibrionales bacterium]